MKDLCFFILVSHYKECAQLYLKMILNNKSQQKQHLCVLGAAAFIRTLIKTLLKFLTVISYYVCSKAPIIIKMNTRIISAPRTAFFSFLARQTAKPSRGEREGEKREEIKEGCLGNFNSLSVSI